MLRAPLAALFASSILALSCARRAEDDTAPLYSSAKASAPALSASAEAVPKAFEAVSARELLARIRRSGKKGTLVNAWASWCGPCRREVPMLQALRPKLAELGIALVLVSVDEPADVPKAEGFLKENRIDLGSYLAERPLDLFKRELNPRWPGMLPASFLFDEHAKLRYFWGGEAFEKEILPVVEGFAAGKNIDGEANFGLLPGKVER